MTVQPKTKLWIFAGVVVLVLAAYLLLIPIPSARITTKTRYDLSKKDLQSLEYQAFKAKNGNAAYRIAQYYIRSKDDVANWLLWVHRAADLGNGDAQGIWAQYKDAVPIPRESSSPKEK